MFNQRNKFLKRNIVNNFLKQNFTSNQILYKKLYTSNPFFCHTQQLLNRFKNSLKKPSARLVIQEDTLIKKQLSLHNYVDVFQFLLATRFLQLASVQTIPLVSQQVNKNWSKLNFNERILCCFSLISHSEYQTYKTLFHTSLSQKKTQPKQLLTEEDFLFLLATLLIQKKHIQHQSLPAYHGIMQPQYSQILNYFKAQKSTPIQLCLHSTITSNLERDIDCFLQVLNYKRNRQVNIIGHDVDFLVEGNLILQVLGGHHYTIQGKLKPKEILRGLTLSRFAPIRFIHFQDYNAANGYRNKIAYIENVLKSQTVNWKPLKQTYDCKWVLDDHYTQFH